jgi:hypothetical protein
LFVVSFLFQKQQSPVFVANIYGISLHERLRLFWGFDFPARICVKTIYKLREIMRFVRAGRKSVEQQLMIAQTVSF